MKLDKRLLLVWVWFYIEVKISDGFKWYVDMANLGIKTYKDDKRDS